MLRIRKRWIAIAAASAAALVVLLVGLAYLLSSPARLSKWTFGLLESRFGIVGRAARLDFDPAALRVHLEKLELAAVGHETQPFLVVDAVNVDVGWSSLWSDISIQSAQLVRPRVSIVKSATAWNLPGRRDGAPQVTGPGPSLRFERLELDDLQIELEDRPAELELSLEDVDIDLTSTNGGAARGPLLLGGGAHLRVGQRETTITGLSGTLMFDGTDVSLAPLELTAREGAIEIEGRVARIFASPELDLMYRGVLELEGVAPWIGPGPPISGPVALIGTASGPASSPSLSANVSGDGLRWQVRHPFGLSASTRVTTSALQVESFAVRIAGGELSGRAAVPFGNEGAESHAQITWNDLDADALLSMVRPDVPVRLGSSLGGDADVSWTELDLSLLGIVLQNRSRSGGIDTGRIDLQAAAGEWHMSVDQRLASARLVGSIEARAPQKGDPFLHSILAGELTLDVPAPELFLKTFTGAWARDLAETMQGSFRIDGDLTGTLGEPRFAGSASAPGMTYRGLPTAAVFAQFTLDPQALVVADVSARAKANEARGELRLSLPNETIGGRFEARLGDLSAFAALVPSALGLKGSAVGKATISGVWSQPHLDATVETERVWLADQPIDRMAASLTLDGGVLNIDRLDAVQGPGRLAADGRFDLEDQTYTAQIDGRDLTLVIPSEGDTGPVLSALLDLNIDSSGSFEAPNGTGRVSARHVSWADIDLGGIETAIAMTDGIAVMRSSMADFGASATTKLDVRAPRPFDLDLTVDQADLGLVAARMPDSRLAVTGAASLRVRASGELDELRTASAALQLERLDGKLGEVPVTLPEPARIEYANDELRAERLAVDLGSSRLNISGAIGRTRPGALNAALQGTLADLDDFRSLAGPTSPAWLRTVQTDGRVNLHASLGGTLERPVITADLAIENGSVAFEGTAPFSGLNARAVLADEVLSLQELRGSWQDATITAAGDLPVRMLADSLPEWYARALERDPSPARLIARLDGPIAPLLAGFSPPTAAAAGGAPADAAVRSDILGDVAASLRLEADRLASEALDGELTLSRLDATLAGVPITQTVPTRLEIEDGRVRVTAWNWAGAGNVLTVGGEMDLGDRTADLTVTGNGDLRLLGAFLRGISTAGQASLVANIQGPFQDPQLAGTVEFRDGELRLAEPRLIVSELDGGLLLQGDRVMAHELRGSANGGLLEIEGALTRAGLQPQGTIRLTGHNVALDYPEGLRTEVNADLALELSPAGLTVSGTTTVLRGDYRQSTTLTGGLLAALRQAQEETAIDAEPGPLDEVRLDLRLVTADDIVVNNNYAEGTLGGDVRLTGTIGRPALAGRATLAPGGRVFLGTNSYEIESGTIDFIDPTRIVPQLNLTARTEVSRYDITLNVSGTPDTFTSTLQSDPLLPEADIVSLLLTGRTLEEAGRAPGVIAREQALGFVSGELLGTAARSFGLDTVRIGTELEPSTIRFDSSLVAGETNPATRLTVAKNLSREVELIVSQNLRESGLITWIMEYLPRANVELRAVVDDRNDRSYEFRHALTFGDETIPTERRAARRPERRVRSVEFSGQPGFDAATLLDVIAVTESDRFDFYRWQDDRERLERFYYERGYLEARIRSRRIETEGSVAIEYEIDSGPRTVLTVEGHRLPTDLVAAMEAEWARAVFDGFLLDELRALVRAHLTGEGFLRAAIDAEVIRHPNAAAPGRPAENAKEIRMRIEEGPPSDRRQLVFRGNEQIDEDQLRAFLSARGLVDTGWFDPETLVRELTGLYRRQGRLAADIEVGQPEFDDATATLPIVVSEGRVFIISEVRLEGVEAQPEDRVRGALGLESGSPYTAAALETARLQLELSYRERGFNMARVSLRSTADRQAGTVAVVVNVDEGPLQILQDIRVEGDAGTDERLIARALDLEIGRPVDLGQWNRARKRLYELGVFRTVDLEAEPLETPPSRPDAGVQPVRARVILDALPSYRVRYGLQLKDELVPFSEQDERELRPGLVGDLTRQNLFGKAATVGTSFRVDTRQQALRGLLSTRSFLGLPITSNVFASGQRQPVGELAEEERRSVALEQQIRPRTGVTISYSYDFGWSSTAKKDVRPGDPFAEPVTLQVARLSGGASFDTRDDLFDATRGSFHSSTIEYAAERLGSDLRFVKYTAQQYHYRPLGRGVVSASAGRFGVGDGFGQELIPSERFFAGGGNSVRGYRQERLGEANIFGDPRGGEALLVLNQEIRFPLYGRLRGVGFVDAGNVFPSFRDLSLRALEVGVGGGLRVETPFGLVRVDFGMPVPKPPEAPVGRWFFSIGQAF